LLAVVTAGCSTPPCDAAPPPVDSGGVTGDAGAPWDGSFNLPSGQALSVTLAGCAGPGYAASFVVGSQQFLLTVDTGSGVLAVASVACAGCAVSPEYSPGSSAVDEHTRASGMYLLGSWQGEVYSDSVQLVGAAAPVTMGIVAIDTQSAFFSDAGCGLGTVPFAPEGIVGFGPPGLAPTGTNAFPSVVALSGARNVFAFEFCAIGGLLMLGGVDPVTAMLTGPAVYTPITSSPYYSVTLSDLQLSRTSLGYGASDFGETAVDTGTSVLALPSAVFDSLSSAIETNPAFITAFGATSGPSDWLGTTDCRSSALAAAQLDAELPALTLVFPDGAGQGGLTTVTLTATQSYLPPTVSNGTTFYCSGIYRNLDTMGATTILGTAAMLGQAVIFDVEGGRIGFAPQAFCP
jgi:hypothetical protein